MGLIPGLGRSPGGGNGYPLQYSFCLENPINSGAWWATVLWGHKESDMTEQLMLSQDCLIGGGHFFLGLIRRTDFISLD